MHGRAKHETVKTARYAQKLVYAIVKDAFPDLRASATPRATGERLTTNLERLGLDAFLVQGPSYLSQSGKRAARFVRTAVYQKNFHAQTLFSKKVSLRS